MLEAAGIEVYLVNTRELKRVPGHKTDVVDCQWLQQLHTVGLLRGSFRPAQDIEPIRWLYRRRENLLKQRATQIHLMQKTLRLMNIQLESNKRCGINFIWFISLAVIWRWTIAPSPLRGRVGWGPFL